MVELRTHGKMRTPRRRGKAIGRSEGGREEVCWHLSGQRPCQSCKHCRTSTLHMSQLGSWRHRMGRQPCRRPGSDFNRGLLPHPAHALCFSPHPSFRGCSNMCGASECILFLRGHPFRISVTCLSGAKMVRVFFSLFLDVL